jgi:hypothetical protein
MFSRLVQTYVTLREARRDRRYPLPELTVTIGETSYPSGNWSHGGVLITAFDGAVEQAQSVAGKVRIGTEDAAYPFQGRVVRFDRATGELALHFENLDSATFDALERGLRRRARPKPG